MTAWYPAPPTIGPLVRRPTAWWARVAAVVVIVTIPVATWWLVGPNPGNEIGSDPELRPDDYDYLFHPPAIDADVERFVGIAAVVGVVVSLGALVFAARRRQIDRRWRGPILIVCAVAVIVGVAERVMTAAVVGANIGGGFFLLFGTPTVLFLLAASIIWSIRILRTTTVSRSERSGSPGP